MTTPLPLNSPAGAGHAGPGESVVRRATGADAAAIGQLCALEARLHERLGGYALCEAFDWTGWVAARLTGPGGCFYVACRDGRVVAYCYGRMRVVPGDVRAGLRGWIRQVLQRLRPRHRRTPASPARLEGWAIIDSLYVVEPERRQGLGRWLVAATRAGLAAQGATRFEISVMAVNETALAFWTRLGFRSFRVHLVGVSDASGAD